jgi:peptide deformylase
MPRQPKILKLHYDNEPILREKGRKLSKKEILSPEIQNLIGDMKYTCDKKKYGVGLSANQVGEAVALSVIAIKSTPARPNLEPFDTVCINTEIIETFGKKEPMWEGCFSTRDINGDPAFAQVPRYEKVRIKYHILKIIFDSKLYSFFTMISNI